MSDVYKTGPLMPVASELLNDARTMRGVVNEAFRRMVAPWEFPEWHMTTPDGNRWPEFVLLPRLAALQARWRRLKLAWAVGRNVYRNGLDVLEEDD